ncbi:MAG: glycoside hydrolase family 3 C-terminal domain-containing protein [Abditibacteriota bacterium]|nr:glycoside hydrolase family 3 C-terminal domain-containing protein [Abditibacteriota bacterium]
MNIPRADKTQFPITREIAREGIVLLKNDNNALPLTGGKIALAGNGAEKLIPGGTGSAQVNVEHIATIPEALTEAGVDFELCGKDALAKSDAETALLVFTHNSGEGGDRYPEKGDWFISEENESLLKTAAGKFRKIIVVLNVPCVIDTSWVDKYPVDAVLLPYQPGQWGAYAIADVLTGKVNPSGKTVDTWAKDINDYPSTANFQQKLRTVNYEEDIFVGYRYFSTFDPEYKKVRYPFGFGLSYTTFDMEVVGFAFGDGIEASVKVTNTGKVPGKEVVQIYCKAPQGKLGKAAMVLTAFGKTKLLAPGEFQVVDLAFDHYAFASYDDTGKTGYRSCYVLEEGVYEFYVGSSVRDARLAASHKADECIVLKQLSERLTPTKLPKVLRGDGSYEKLSDYDGISDKIANIRDGFGILRVEDALDGPDRFAFEHFENGSNGYLECAITYGNAYNLTYKLNVEKAGKYFVRFRCFNGEKVTRPNFADLIVNGKKANLNLTCEPTGDFSWDSRNPVFVNVDGGAADLPAGEVDLTFAHNEGNGIRTAFIMFAEKKEDLDAFEAANPHLFNTIAHIDESKLSGGSDKGITPDDVKANPDLLEDFVEQFSDKELAEVVTLHTREVPGTCSSIGRVDRLGFSGLHTFDGPCGVRMNDSDSTAVAWPAPILVSSTFNPNIAEKIGEGVAKESKARNLMIWLAPGLNIHRNPLCGRNFEYFSEDPLVAGKFAAAYVRGAKKGGVDATCKHFAFNNRERSRHYCDSRLTERAAREIYLKGFEIAVKESPLRYIMTSYNLVNGTQTAESKDLLTHILREEWGYTGTVMTDWDNNSQTYKEVLAGNNTKMPFGSVENILDALIRGDITREELKRNAVTVMRCLLL